MVSNFSLGFLHSFIIIIPGNCHDVKKEPTGIFKIWTGSNYCKKVLCSNDVNLHSMNYLA